MDSNILDLSLQRLSIPKRFLILLQHQLGINNPEKPASPSSFSSISSYVTRIYNSIIKDPNHPFYEKLINTKIGLSDSSLERVFNGRKGSKIIEIKYEVLNFLCYACWGVELSEKIFEFECPISETVYSVNIPIHERNNFKSFNQSNLSQQNQKKSKSETINRDLEESNPNFVTADINIVEPENPQNKTRYKKLWPVYLGTFIIMICAACYIYYRYTNTTQTVQVPNISPTDTQLSDTITDSAMEIDSAEINTYSGSLEKDSFVYVNTLRKGNSPYSELRDSMYTDHVLYRLPNGLTYLGTKVRDMKTPNGTHMFRIFKRLSLPKPDYCKSCELLVPSQSNSNEPVDAFSQNATNLLENLLDQNLDAKTLEKIHECVSKGANVNIQGSVYKRCVLHAAAIANDTILAQSVLQHKDVYLNLRDLPYYTTPIWYASKYNSMAVAKLLFDYGEVNVNGRRMSKYNNYSTPLDSAKTDEMRYLLWEHRALTYRQIVNARNN